MLNPESLSLKRIAGVRPRASLGGAFTATGLSDNPLLHTGGGLTELNLDLLFDVDVSGSTIKTRDVRELTSPFWELAENMIGTDGTQCPPQVRFVWGKSWNIPGVVVAVSETFDKFTRGGSPTRSWIRLKMLRTLDIVEKPINVKYKHKNFLIPEKREDLTLSGFVEHIVTLGDRLDMLAFRYFGNASLWRHLASYNNIDDPHHPESIPVLQLPSDIDKGIDK